MLSRRTTVLLALALALTTVGCSDFDLLGQGDDDDSTPAGDDDATDEEICNGLDDDGDGAVDEGFPDHDGDGIADCVDDGCQVPLAEPVSELDAGCDGEVELGPPPADPWAVVVEWSWTGGECFATPVVGDLDLDGVPEVALTYSDEGYDAEGSLVVLRGDDGTPLWSVPGVNGMGGAALGDVDGDGFGDVVVNTWIGDGGQSQIVALDAGGEVLWTSEIYELWREANNPAIADLEGDGAVEVIANDRIFAGASGATLRVLEPGTSGTAWGQPVAVDMDLDGDLEILLENRLHDHDGTLRFECGEGGLMTFPHPIDVDGDDEAELLVSGWGSMTLCDDDGTELWSRIDHTYLEGPPSVIADFDGDGVQEIASAEKDMMRLLEPDGSVSWYTPIQDLSGAAGSSGWDLTLDGVPEVLYADEQDLHVFDMVERTAVVIESLHTSVTGCETPVAADVDGDGHGELLFVSNGGEFQGLRVLGSANGDWPHARPVYNQQTYSGGNVADDLSIPVQPTPPWLDQDHLFRGQPSALHLTARPNLRASITDVCVASCEAGGYAEVAVQVVNDGGAAVAPGATIRLYGTGTGDPTVLTELPLTVALDAQSSWEVVVPTTSEQLGGALILIADEDDGVFECHEDDNLDSLAVDICSD